MTHPAFDSPDRCSVCLEVQFETPGGVTCSNGHGGAEPGEPPAYRFEPETMDDVVTLMASAAGAQCFVCRRDPWPKDLRYKNLAICAPCAPAARQRELMNDVTDQEMLALRDGIDRGGEYLSTIGKFDLTELSTAESDKFAAHFLCGFSESMRERARDAPPF